MSTLTNAVAFEKYHGTGNDFIIVDATDPVPDRSEFATTHCDRSTGVGSDTSGRIGADGVLFLHLEDRFSPPRIIMTLVQPDGSVAPICGNGARCAAVWAMDRTDAEAVMIDTQAGTRRATRVDDGIAVEMGEPTFDPSRLPLTSDQTEPLVQESVEGLTVTAVNTGVPHAVAFVDDIESVDIEAVAPAVRHADLFAAGTNVTFAEQVDERREGVPRFRQRSYERGIEGETEACGTGSVAIAAAASRIGLIESAAASRIGLIESAAPVDISLPGGELQIEATDRGELQLTGTVTYEFDGDALTTDN
jgi:diaminopimelate epimerase